jgi:hypothetical protein
MRWAPTFVTAAGLSIVAAGCGSSSPTSTLTLVQLRSASTPPSYFLGENFDGLPLTATLGRRDAPDFVYGDCTPPPGIDAGGCPAPLELQHWPVAKRPPSKFGPDIACHRVKLSGRVAAVFESTGGMEVYVGRRTVVIFADSARRTRRAGESLRPVKGGALPPPPAWVERQLARRCT